MDNLNNILRASYGINDVTASFCAGAAYFEDLDCVTYLSEDTTAISERIDNYLTMYSNLKGEPIGFKLKGFRWYFNEHLKALYDLTDDDFINLIEVIRSMAKEQAASILKDPTSDNNRIKEAYKSALRLAKVGELQVSAYQFKDAA